MAKGSARKGIRVASCSRRLPSSRPPTSRVWRTPTSTAGSNGWSSRTGATASAPASGSPSPTGAAAAAAVAYLDGDGRPKLVVVSGGAATVGWGLDATGRAAGGWGPWTEVPGWPGGTAALTGPRELAAVAGGVVTTMPLALDVDEAGEKGVWRILDFDSQILAVHAALLHTGDVLFFAG